MSRDCQCWWPEGRGHWGFSSCFGVHATTLFGRCNAQRNAPDPWDAGHLGGLAEFERDLIRTVPAKDGSAPKARGVKLGRKPKLTEHQKREAIRRGDHDDEPMREIARSYNVSHSTISRLTEWSLEQPALFPVQTPRVTHGPAFVGFKMCHLSKAWSLTFTASANRMHKMLGSRQHQYATTIPQGPNRYVVDIVWIKERARAGAETNEAAGQVSVRQCNARSTPTAHTSLLRTWVAKLTNRLPNRRKYYAGCIKGTKGQHYLYDKKV